MQAIRVAIYSHRLNLDAALQSTNRAPRNRNIFIGVFPSATMEVAMARVAHHHPHGLLETPSIAFWIVGAVLAVLAMFTYFYAGPGHIETITPLLTEPPVVPFVPIL